MKPPPPPQARRSTSRASGGSEEDEQQRKIESEDARRRQEMYGANAALPLGPKTPRAESRTVPDKTTPAVVQIADIKSRWAAVLKKASENKINVKNAWNVTQFESLPLLARSLGEEGDFHTSGVAIESAAKVFSYKVDALLLQSSKAQTAITRGAADEKDSKGKKRAHEEEGEEAEGEGEANNEETAENPKKRVKRRKHVATIAEPADINIKSHERQAAVDPLFAQTSSNFDQGGAAGLLVMNCPFGKHINIQLDSTSCATFATAAADAQSAQPDNTAIAIDIGELTLPSTHPPPPSTPTKTEGEPAETDNNDAVSGLHSVLLPEESVADLADLGDASPDSMHVDGRRSIAFLPEVADGPPSLDGSVAGDAVSAVAPEAEGQRDEVEVAPLADVSADLEAERRLQIIETIDANQLQEHMRGPEVDDVMDDFDAPDDRQESDGEGAASPAPSNAKPEYTVSGALALTEGGEEEVMRMHKGGTDPMQQTSGWQGLGDSKRWMALRREAPAKSSKAPKEKAVSTINFAMFDDAGHAIVDNLPRGCETEDRFFAKKLAPAKNKDTLLLARSKARHNHNETMDMDDDTAKVFHEDFFDASVFTTHYKNSKFMLPEDHMVTTDDFFTLNCMPGWSLLQKRRANPAPLPTTPHAPSTAGFGDHMDVYEDATTAIPEVIDEASPAGDTAFFDMPDADSDVGGDIDDEMGDEGVQAGEDFSMRATQEAVQPTALPAMAMTDTQDSAVLFQIPEAPEMQEVVHEVLPPLEEAAGNSFSPTPELSAFRQFADLGVPSQEGQLPDAAEILSNPLMDKYVGSLVFDANSEDVIGGTQQRASVDMNGVPLSLSASQMQLVAKPKEVAKIRISHATKAKVVDIKKLKDTMWECILAASGETVESAKGKKGVKVPALNFSDLIRTMQPKVAVRRIAVNAYEVRNWGVFFLV